MGLLTDTALIYGRAKDGGPWELEYAPAYPCRTDVRHATAAGGKVFFFAKLDEDNAANFGWNVETAGTSGWLVTRDENGQWLERPAAEDTDPPTRLTLNDGLLYRFGPEDTFATSDDGATWSDPRPMAGFEEENGYAELMPAEGVWFRIHDGLQRSDDLVTWTQVWEQPWQDRFFRKMLVSDGTTSVLACTTEIVRLDLATEAVQTVAMPEGLRGPVTAALWDGIRYIITGRGRAVFTSGDGLAWTELTSGSDDDADSAFQSLAFADGVYVASSDAGAWRSSDLVNWILTQAVPDETRPHVTHDNGHFWLYLRSEATETLYVSDDGVDWTACTPAPARVDDIANGIAVGGNFIYRLDGATVEQVHQFRYNNPKMLEFGIGRFALFGGSGLEVASTDSPDQWATPKFWGDAVIDPEGFLFADGRCYYVRSLGGGFGSFRIDAEPIVDQRGTGTLSIDYVQHASESGYGQARVVISREGGSVGAVSVIFSTAGGTATADADYTPVEQTLTWDAGDTSSRVVYIQIATDQLAEGDETIRLELSDATGGASIDPEGGIAECVVHDTAFGAWRFAHLPEPNGPDAQPSADPDGDGISNLNEYLLWLDPLEADADPLARIPEPVSYPGIGQFAWQFVVRNDRDPNHRLRWIRPESGKLENWSLPSTLRRVETSRDRAVELLQLPAPAPGQAIFFRLRLE